jgi:glucose-1-phosphate cytidylyltransferase
MVTSLGELGDEDFWINGGFFVMSQEIFDYMHEGEELVEQPFARLIDAKKLRAFPHTGFWQPMDTFKDKISFDRAYAHGETPWQVWQK